MQPNALAEVLYMDDLFCCSHVNVPYFSFIDALYISYMKLYLTKLTEK